MPEPTMQQLFVRKDWEALLDRIARRWEVPFDRDRMRELLEHRYHQALRSADGVDDMFAMWLKLLLQELNAFTHGNNPTPNDNLTVELHVAFLYLEETEEMLARLRNEAPKKPQDVAPATSKVFSSPVVPHPIDRVAARGANARENP